MKVLLLLAPIFIAAAATIASASASPADFIRTNCDTTLYPDLCYHSLAGYANAVQSDPARLARVAVGVCLSRAKRTTLYVANLTRQADYSPDHRAAAALHDCSSVLGDAVDQIRGSLKQMRRLTARTTEDLRFQLSNVQTWMSAALTNEDTCVDGLDDVDDGPVKADVSARILKVKEVTSNALALVNMFVTKVTSLPN
ncbi:21 kDa protein-like [Salvia hispanica]|uniref:21 kDa protein-like n=1 Tax=Salvia hispanica TaxID=49212 RepID=UPI00200974A5|nr:21 kDa protein-like [Salvia hispanica]